MEGRGVLLLLGALLIQSAVLVKSEYGKTSGPVTCLCADGVSRILDSNPLVRKYGCSLFDHCQRCTSNPYQPCEECPPNRYGRMCENECDCGLEMCDDGINGDGECHCGNEEFNEGNRCQYMSKIVSDRIETPPSPDVRVLESHMLITWQQRLYREDPVVSYKVEYRVARDYGRYSDWTLYATMAQSNETSVIFPYESDDNAFYIFRITAVHQQGIEVMGQSTDAVKIPGTPQQPGNLRVQIVQGNSITLAWDTPQEDASFGGEVLGYIVQMMKFGHTDWVTYADSDFVENTIRVMDLEFTSIYRFRVAARNRLGIGPWSNEESHLLTDSLECFNNDDASDYRGSQSETIDGYDCIKWTDIDPETTPLHITSSYELTIEEIIARSDVFAYNPESSPSQGIGEHNFCRNPRGVAERAWCYATLDAVQKECDVGTPSQDPCPSKCAPGLMLSSTGTRDCVPDDESRVYSKVPLTNGEICTCSFQAKTTGEYLKPQSYLGWTYACAHAVSQSSRPLIENIFSMDADVCYHECIQSDGCEAFAYSTNGFNETMYINQTNLRLCTLFSNLHRPVEIQKADVWTRHLSQEIPDDNYILSWGCWSALDPRNPSEIWEGVNTQNFLVFDDVAYKNYTINITISMAPDSGMYISIIIIGTSNVTDPISLNVENGENSFLVSHINVGFITTLKVVGQIGQPITVEQIFIEVDTFTITFEGDWCGDGDYIRNPKECPQRACVGGPAASTRLLRPAQMTVFAKFHGFACSFVGYTGSSSEAFFGWCPLTPRVISVGLPQVWPDHFVALLNKEDTNRQRRAAEEENGEKYFIYEEEKTWHDAVDTCLQNGQVLVKIPSDTILQEVKELVVGSTSLYSDFWINGYNSGSLNWKTHDKQPLPPFEPRPWEAGEPNLSGKCLQLWWRGSTVYKFDDDSCSQKKKFICQSQISFRTSECIYNNERYGNSECVAMLDFNIEDMRNEFLEDKSVIVEEVILALNFRGERHLRYLALEGISEPWTRTAVSGVNIPASVLIDVIDTNSTTDMAIEVVSESLRKWIEERLNGHSVAGRYGVMIRALRDYQQAGFDDIIDWSGSSLRPRMKLKVQVYKWLVGPWSECTQSDQACAGGLQSRKVSCIDAATNVPVDENFCRFHPRPHSEQSCVTSFEPSCYAWRHLPDPNTACRNTGGCGIGTIPGHIICQDTYSMEKVPEYYCRRHEKPSLEDFPEFGCSDFTRCTYDWEMTDWSECSDDCGGGYVARSADCFSSNGTQVDDKKCTAVPKPTTQEKCQNYSGCDVWESLQLLRQDQIYSDRSQIQRQINLTVPMVQAEAALMDAKQNIAAKHLEHMLQTIRANMSIPEELAKAESLEALARQAVAKNTIQIPREGSFSYPNVGYLGRGYDIFFGNPMNDDGSVDPGFRQAVIGLTYDQVRYSADRKFLVPDQADIIREMGSYFGSTTSIITSERSYKESLATEVSVGGSYSGLFASGSFSASASYAKMKQSTMNSQSVFVDIIGRVLVYDARLVPFNMQVSKEFREAVSKLPGMRCCGFSTRCHPDCKLYDEFIAAFGTHYTQTVLMGGRAVQRYQMTSNSMEEHQSQDVGVGFSASGGFGGVASFSASASFKMSNSMSNSLSTSSASSKEFFLGGEAGVGEISEGSTDSMKEWSSTVFDNPVPIRYKLSTVLDLITTDIFPDDSKIQDKQEVLQSRYQSYCGRIPNAQCGDFSTQEDIQEENVVHFGDVVHFIMDSTDGKQFVMQEKLNALYVTSSDKDFRYWFQTPTITSLSGKLCTWVQKTSRGRQNPHGTDWLKFMTEVTTRIHSRSVIYRGMSQDVCEERCKQRSNCKAGSHTSAVANGFCILFTSPEHDNFRAQLGYADDLTYHWSCYNEFDPERFGEVWRDLRIYSFRARFKIGERRKMFSMLSPLSINNVKKETIAYGDPVILVGWNGVVSQYDDFWGIFFSSENVFDKKHLRFQFVNDYKTNGMPVMFGDDIMIAELPRDDAENTHTFLMQPLPAYLTVPAEGYDRYTGHQMLFAAICFIVRWFTELCFDDSTIAVRSKPYDSGSTNAYVWNITKADIRGLIPQPSPTPLSGLETVDFVTLEDLKSLSVKVKFTRPVRRRTTVPDTVADESPNVGSLPGYDARELISSDFNIRLKRGQTQEYSPVQQYFVYGGRETIEFQLKVVFQVKVQDGDTIRLDLSDQIVSEDSDELGGELFVEEDLYLEPSFTVEIADASSLLTNDEEGLKNDNFTLRVNFNKPVVNSERELPKIYDFELLDVYKQPVSGMILRVEQARTGCSSGNIQPCPTDFNIVVSTSFLDGQRKFYFDVASARLKSKSDFTFVSQQQTLIDIDEVIQESEPDEPEA